MRLQGKFTLLLVPNNIGVLVGVLAPEDIQGRVIPMGRQRENDGNPRFVVPPCSRASRAARTPCAPTKSILDGGPGRRASIKIHDRRPSIYSMKKA